MLIKTRWIRPLLSLGVLAGLSWMLPAWGQDPFRSGEDSRSFSPEVNQAFEEFFCAGRYLGSQATLESALAASPDEPMIYALLASIAYFENDLEDFSAQATQTREVAVQLKEADPLRGHLYEGVGYGLEAAYTVIQDGVVIGLPKALPTLNNLFESVREAQAIDAEDPELNLINGYIDLLLSNRDKALAQFQEAAPPYLAYRGQALTYRDLKQYPEALEAVDQALSVSSCTNPELYYLKAQILAAQERYAEAVPFFDQSLAASDQLPEALVSDIKLERDRAVERSLTSSTPPTASPAP